MIPDPMQPAPAVIDKVRRENHDTFTLELISGNGPFALSRAGQFNMLYVFGVGEIPVSISGDPGDRKRFVHTTRVVGTVTRGLEKLKKGASVGVRGPFGSSWPVDEAKGKDVLLIAGGIGIAPLRSALYALLTNRNQYGKITLLYGTRTPDDLLFQKEWDAWRWKNDVGMLVTVDRAVKGWKGWVGVVTTFIKKLPLDPKKTVAMACGPEIMMRFAVRELEQRGIAGKNIFLSMERNMKCAIGFCGHCMWGPQFVCKEGPVFRYDKIAHWFGREGF